MSTEETTPFLAPVRHMVAVYSETNLPISFVDRVEVKAPNCSSAMEAVVLELVQALNGVPVLQQARIVELDFGRGVPRRIMVAFTTKGTYLMSVPTACPLPDALSDIFFVWLHSGPFYEEVMRQGRLLVTPQVDRLVSAIE